MVRVFRLVPLFLLSTAVAGAAFAVVDPAALPLGDGRYTTSAKAGYVDSCQTSFTGGGAQVNGPWISGATWDSTQKLSVQGGVRWHGRFTATVSGANRILAGNGLPLSPTGVFPVASTDPAFQYDRNPNSIKGYTLRVS